MNIQRLCVWSGPAFLGSFGAGFVGLARFLPPPAPGMGADQVAEMYRADPGMKEAGVVLMLLSCGFLLSWAAVISEQMRRIPGCASALVYTQMLAGATGMIFLADSCLLWGLAGFRPEHDPAIAQMLNDLAWLSLIVPVSCAIFQALAIGIAILGDKSEQPLFPRWSGYFNLWIGVSFVPGFAALFFKSGPFAWNGILPFWIPLSTLGAWLVVMTVLLLKALKVESSAFIAARAPAEV
jgi:hypothetical protein